MSTSATPAPNNCPNCGPYDCYNICPNSPHYYSPEQERYDDQRYVSDAEYYREAGYDDPDLYADRDDEAYELENRSAAAVDATLARLQVEEITNGLDVPDPLTDIMKDYETFEVARKYITVNGSDPDDIPF